MTEIAVLMPCYNPSIAELVGTLDSLRTQSLPYRLYLVDDGSKKLTDYESLVRGIDTRILRLPKNLGITGAMNAGLDEILKGQCRYIIRIDCGDFCAPERFAKQKAFMDANTEIGILGSAVEFRLFDANGMMLGVNMLRFPATHDECMNYLYLRTAMIHPAMIIRRAVFEKLKGYSEDYQYAEDYELQWRAAAHGFKLANLPETLLIKEETPGSISQLRRRKQIFNRMRIQWAYLNPLSLRSWAGIAKSMVTWVAPASAVHHFKFLLGRQERH